MNRPIINNREPTPGFWWCRIKSNDEITVVRVTGDVFEMYVKFIGNEGIFELEDVAEEIDFLQKMKPPIIA